ncbi:MAG: DNA translocase FtsK [Chloroflexia bacterium]|nr:DNA translocase FtsK [Chloroflexia bacterium]
MAKRRTTRKSSSSSRSRSSSSRSRSNSSRSRSSSSRRRPTSSRRRRKPLQFNLDPRLQREILGLLLLALSVITLLSLFSDARQGFSYQWREAVRMLFGLGGFFVPLALGTLAVLILWGEFKQEPQFDWNDILGWLLIYVALLGLLALPTASDPQALLLVEGRWGGGGLVGHTITSTLVGAMRGAASFFLLLVVGLIGAMMAFDISVHQLIAVLVSAGQALTNRVREYRERPELVIHTNQNGASRRRRALVVEGEVLQPALPESTEVEEQGGEDKQSFPRIIGRPERKGGISMALRPTGEWHLPPIDLLEQASEAEISQAEIRQKARMIEETLESFHVKARVVEVNCGPVVTQFALQPGVGVKVSKITSLSNDLALALAAPSIRIEAPVPGRPVIGIEIPNTAISLVTLREIIESEAFLKGRGHLKIALGRDVSGQPVVEDLTKMPHILIAGTTGSGKSVCINAMIISFLYQHNPDTLRFIMIDPKRVELSMFRDIPHLAFPVVTEVNGRRAGGSGEGEVDALKVLYWATQEMERRYRVFSREGFRNIFGYNKAARAQQNPNLPPMPFVVLVIDELADLMMVAPEEAETMICRLAQLARATGIHLVLATQRPSVDVVTGLIKANFPSRVSFAVSTSVDSRVVLDTAGAEQLLGSGDMLYMAPDSPKLVRIQGTFLSDEEIEHVVTFWREQRPGEQPPISPVQLSMPLSWKDEVVGESPPPEEEDDLLPEAIDLVRKHQRASAALLQRRLRVSYNRAGRLIELLEQRGVVGPEEKGRSREVLLDSEQDA